MDAGTSLPSPKFISFWQAIVNQDVNRNGNIWDLGANAAWIGGTKYMYVRDCYVEIANQLLGEANVADLDTPVVAVPIALILGPKGIGKTMFLNYLMVRIVDKARAEDTLDKLSIVYYHQSHGSTEEGIRFTPLGGCSISAAEADYYLSDSLDIADGELGDKLLLEVASENQNNYKKFSDRLTEGNGKSIIMDVWALDEL